MKKKTFLFLILCSIFFACSKEYETNMSDNLTEEKQSVTFHRNSEKENDYYVANFVSPENVGLHHTSCVRYVMDNLKKRNETPSEINNFLINGQVLQLFDEYRELNGLPTISLPNYSAPETYQDFFRSK